MEGGSSNAHDYCSGDPVNCSDLLGLKEKRDLPPGLRAPCFYEGRGTIADMNRDFHTDECDHYRLAVANEDNSIYYDFVEHGRWWNQPNRPNAFLTASARFLNPIVDNAYGYGISCLYTGGTWAVAAKNIPYVGPIGGAIAGCAVAVGGRYYVRNYIT